VVDGDASAAAHLGSLHDQMIAWAKSGSGFAVIDTAPGLSVSGAIDYVDARTESSSVAGYYPHYYISDPVARSRQALRKVGPASAVAGLYLATDKAAGPFKTPAGTGTSVRGAVSLERAFTPKDLDSLNTGVYASGGTTYYKTPINAVRNLPGAGIVVMGGRTLLQDGTANRYVNTRRSLIYIRKSLENITQFAVFRNNDAKLWAQLNTAVSVFLNEYRNQGGLRGNTPGQAYYIKVNSSNNTSASIAEGIVNIEVGVALEYPAEFVVINLSQITGN
jgi:phage tail sheath protein FI